MSPPYIKFDVKAYMRGEPQPSETARRAAAPSPANPYKAWVEACQAAGNWDLPFEPYAARDQVEPVGRGSWDQIPPAYSLRVAEALRAEPDAESVLIAKITGPLLLRLEAWGRNAGFKPGDARRLLADLFDAAGPARQRHIPGLFEMCVRKVGIVDRAKIDWLRKQVALIRNNDTYFPRERPEIRDDRARNAVLEVVRGGPGQVADIGTMIKRLGRTRDAIVGLTRRLVDEQLIVRTGPGQFTLPGNDAAPTAPPPAAEQVVAWFRAQPRGTCARAVEIAVALGRTRQAIDSALHGHGQLVRRGLIVWAGRGLFKLPDNAA